MLRPAVEDFAYLAAVWVSLYDLSLKLLRECLRKSLTPFRALYTSNPVLDETLTLLDFEADPVLAERAPQCVADLAYSTVGTDRP